MYLSSAEWQAFEDRYGRPREIYVTYCMNPREFENLLKSQRHGRRHDITFFIKKDQRWVVVAKHWYPPGLYRIPSGGILPGESIEAGILREAHEETGAQISLRRYFLRVYVSFENQGKEVEWISHLVCADWLSGELRPIDTREIREVRLAEEAEFRDFGAIMLGLDVGGLRYREFLHRIAFETLPDPS